MASHLLSGPPRSRRRWTHRASQVPRRGRNVWRRRRKGQSSPAALAAAVPRHRRRGDTLAVAGGITLTLRLARAASQDECAVGVHRAKQLFPAPLLQQRAVQGLHL